jgi:hypothetical protein
LLSGGEERGKFPLSRVLELFTPELLSLSTTGSIVLAIAEALLAVKVSAIKKASLASVRRAQKEPSFLCDKRKSAHLKITLHDVESQKAQGMYLYSELMTA